MNGPAVISMNLVLVFFVKVPIALNATVPPVGTLPGSMVVLVAAGRGVNVGVGHFGVLVGVGVFWALSSAVAVGVNVGVGGAPFAIVIDSSENPGDLVGRRSSAATAAAATQKNRSENEQHNRRNHQPSEPPRQHQANTYD